MWINYVIVTVNGPKTTILPLPSELVLNDTNYFILSNVTKWKKNLKMDAKNQWKYTLLKNVTTSMFILDKNNPRNAVIFNGGENCSTSFMLDFHVPSKCEINFLYKNQRLTLKSENTEETLIGQKFKLYFHEGKLVGIQMHPFKVVELNVCEIETLAAHVWKIYDVKETCQNTNFIFHQSVQIAVENITNPVKPTYKTSAKTTHFKTVSITTTTKTADASTDNTWIWIIIALIIIFLILVFGGLLLYNYCSTKKESKTSTDGLSKKIENHKQKIKAKKRQQKELSEAAPASLQAFPSIV
uniref:Uncharacterized protein n=1 Tax=Panagrolaimus davidi TaxID=227884 RepID=A0A914PGI3_9BILA